MDIKQYIDDNWVDPDQYTTPDAITKAERRLSDVCLLCGEGEGYTESVYPSVDEHGVTTVIHFTLCANCGGGYWV